METKTHSYVLIEGERSTVQWCVERMEIGGHWCEKPEASDSKSSAAHSTV